MDIDYHKIIDTPEKKLSTWQLEDAGHQLSEQCKMYSKSVAKQRMLQLCYTNKMPGNQYPVVAASGARDWDYDSLPWWVRTPVTLQDWVAYALVAIELTRRQTGGVAFMQAYSPYWDSLLEDVKKFEYYDIVHDAANLPLSERMSFWAKIQCEHFIPKIERMSNVHMNGDGSGLFLDGLMHTETYSSWGVYKRFKLEYDEEGECRRCKTALDDAITYAGDLYVPNFIRLDEELTSQFHSDFDFEALPNTTSEDFAKKPTLVKCLYNGYYRYNHNLPQVVIGSEEYDGLLNGLIMMACTRDLWHCKLMDAEYKDKPYGYRDFGLYKSPNLLIWDRGIWWSGIRPIW